MLNVSYLPFLSPALFNKNDKIIEHHPGEKIIFIYVGVIIVLKGIKTLLIAWEKLLQKYGDTKGIELKLIGEVKENFELKPMPSSVSHLGYLPHNELKKELLNAHVFIFPTLNDSYGMVIQEAISFNLPVITNINCGASDFIKDGFNGLIIKDPFSSIELQEKIEYFIKHPDQIKRMSENQNSLPKYDSLNEKQRFGDELKRVGIL